tara:strand:+ start:136 stop:381 length:246 start_codon:yes stop_codon:yes gene_type:complete
MEFFVKINILPQEALLDPQGKTVESNTMKMGIDNISNIRIGKHITLVIKSDNVEEAKKTTELICEKLLVNQITEQYSYEIL